MFEDIWSDEPLTWDSYIENLMFPWNNNPQVRFLTGRSPLPEYSRSSIAAGATWFATLHALNLSTRALVTSIMAKRYVTPALLPAYLGLGFTYGLGKIHQSRKSQRSDLQYDSSIDYSQYIPEGTRGV